MKGQDRAAVAEDGGKSISRLWRPTREVWAKMQELMADSYDEFGRRRGPTDFLQHLVLEEWRRKKSGASRAGGSGGGR